MPTGLFTKPFITTVQSLVELHHTIYPRQPPQGIFFEDLVQQAFKKSGWSEAQVVPTTPNSPQHDLLVGDKRLSIKTEAGKITDANFISITKLCTTEKEPWNSATLIQHTMEHLSRYDYILMLRAIWHQRIIHYQLLEIPVDVLKLIGKATCMPVGRRKGRRSLAADIYDKSEKVFRVHFDGADGKCQVKNLLVTRCRLLLEWDQPISG